MVRVEFAQQQRYKTVTVPTYITLVREGVQLKQETDYTISHTILGVGKNKNQIMILENISTILNIQYTVQMPTLDN